MSYNVKTITVFERQAKRLVKKYPSLKSEILQLVHTLKEIPQKQGFSLGNNCYKIRVAIASKGKGKSGGARIIIHLQISESVVFLLSIYDKSEQADITNAELNELLKFVK